MEGKEARSAEYKNLLEQLSAPEIISGWEKGDESFEELIKRKGFLEKIMEKEKELQELQEKIEEDKGILKSKEDSELFSLAETEITQLKEKQNKLEEEIKTLLVEEDKSPSPSELSQEAMVKKETKSPSPPLVDIRVSEGEKENLPKSVIVEIRAGAGGQEASLFVADLFRMYSKYAQYQNWRQKLLDSRRSEQGGFKEIVFELTGNEVFQKIINEGGVHRVQRIPQTEKSGRIHTSTATVAVLPKPKKTQIKIKPEDLRVDLYRSSGPGGQYVNKRETAVRITHLPTGIVVTSQTERNQLQNKENALSILSARILEKKEEEELKKLGTKRKSQIGRAQRAEKIRTYNFPQDRITDHRIKKTFHNIEGVMAGRLDPLVEALEKNQA